MEMKNVIAREGREAKNLILYHLSSEDEKTNMKKPPTHVRPSTLFNRKISLSETQSSDKSNRRVRSASTGRDKRSELQARYWALLLSNLQRAVNDIYQTVECYENLASCQEVILVLENYTRDFRALAEWFRVSWDYDATPLPQRPQFLAWEVRKSNPAPPIRAKSLSSPSPNASGKSSPCPSFSGKMSPLPAADDMKSPRKKLLDIKTNIALTSKPIPSDRNLKSPRLNLTGKSGKSETESNNQLLLHENGVSNIETELTKIPEESQHMTWGDLVEQEESQDAIEKPTEENVLDTAPCEPVLTFDQYSQTSGFIDEYLTLQQWRDKYENNDNTNVGKVEAMEKIENPKTAIESAVSHTTNKLDEMENVFLEKNANQPSNRIQTTVELSKENELNPKNVTKSMDDVKSAIGEDVDKKSQQPEEKKVQTGTQMKYSNVVVRLSGVSKPNNLQKVTANRLHTVTNAKQSINVAGRSFATPNPVGNSFVVRRQPLKSAPIAPMTRPKVVPSKESAIRDADKRTVRPAIVRAGVPSNTASRLAARSKTMIDLNKAPTSNANIQKSTSKDSMGSSTSTLRASNEQISSSQTKLNVRRSEPRTLAVRNEDDDGWLTVKARRRSSLHWSNRFNQPSGYASLPTLALLNEKESTKPCNKKENKKIAKTTQSKSVEVETSKPKAVAVSTSNGTGVKEKTGSSSVAKPNPNNEPKPKIKTSVVDTKTKSSDTKDVEKTAPIVSRATILQRQRSDVTGLKLNSLRKEYFRNEKIKKLKDSKKSTTVEQTNEQKNSVNMNIQTNAKVGLSSAMHELYTSCLESDSSNNEINKRDTESDDTEIESDENQRALLEEQWCLERQIYELQNTEIDVDTEIDEAECDNILGLSEGESTSELGQNECDDLDMNLEAKYQHLLSDLSTGERIQTLATLQAFVSRHPGRAQELHQKLSSPSHRSLTEILKKYQEKQERARDARESLNKEKTLKLQALLARVEDVKIAKQKLIEEKRLRMEEKLQRYAENRNQYIKHKIRKAHDEEEKLKEIAFIKSLEAQNKRIDFMELKKEQEGRLQDLEAERQKRVEEKAAKEAAVERRRLELALERQKRLERIDETRREREQRIVSMQEKREKMRLQIARDKARDREERLLALQVQQQQTTEELQRKIEQKQQESARRHEENIEHIRQRALELSIPSRNIDDTNSNRNDDGSEHTPNDDLSSIVSDLSIDQTRASKKKLKKLRQRMSQLADEYMKDLEPVPLYMKRDSSIPKILASIRKGGGPQGMERPLGQLSRTVAKAEVFDFQCLWLMDGLGSLATIIKSALEPNSEISRKALIMAIQIYRDACSPCIQIARHAILGNSISILFDVLLHSLQTPDEKTSTHPIELSTELMLATTVVLSPFNVLKQPLPRVMDRLPDIVSYAVSIGLIDALSKRCMKIREPIESHQSVVLSVLACLGLLTKFTDICPKDSSASKLLSVVKSTELFGTISLLYATIVPAGECIPTRTISVAASAFNLILTIANLDLNVFQSIMSQESLSLQFLDVVTILLKYCGPKSSENTETQAVIVDLVATLGFFCANNKQNQNLLISDQSSIIMKSLSKLPKFFDIVVYPTLLTIICDNDGAKNVIGKEFDMKRIEDYEKSDASKKNKMLAMLQSNSKENKKLNK